MKGKLKKILFVLILLFVSWQSGAQQRDITGTVKDEKNIPLPGVAVNIKNTSTGTATNFDGEFSLVVPDNPDLTLVVSYLGFVPKEIKIGSDAMFDIVLQTDLESLDEVVLVGYGTQREISVVGSQSTVEPEDLQVPAGNLTNTLAGRMSGVVAVQRTGEPGYDDSDIWIRGISTFSQGLSKPLVLVDGVPRKMANIDPEDIASFSVLKDASATAVYGVRGANGVVLIETKKGRIGKPQFSVRYYEGFTKFTKLPQFADGPTFMRMSNEALENRGAAPIYSKEAIQATKDGTDPYLYPNVNWMDEMFNKFGRQRRANLNISGGSEFAKFYVGISYLDELGMYKQGDLTDYNNQIGFKRYNLSSNTVINASETTRANAS